MRDLYMALAMAAWAALMAQISLVQFGSGRANVPQMETEYRRDANPFGFWGAWIATTVFAAALVGVAVQAGFRYAHGDPATGMRPGLDWLGAAILLWMLVAWTWGRGGLPHTQFRRARERWRLRARFVALTADRETGMKDISFDEFLDLAEVEWLDDVLLQLALQPEPRSLAKAISATDEAAAPTTAGASSP
jgi:hypothetical protein